MWKKIPYFIKEDSEEIVGSFDFIGINFYTADIVYTKESDPNVVSYYADQDVSSYKVDIYSWRKSSNDPSKYAIF